MNAHSPMGIRTMRGAGMSWLQISCATGIPQSTLRYRYTPAAREAQQRARAAYLERLRANDGKPLSEPRRLKPKVLEAAIAETCAHFSLSRRDLIEPSHFAHIAEARHVAMFIANEMANASYCAISRAMRRDPTTVRVGCRKIAARVAAGDPISDDVEAIRRRVSQRKGVGG